MINSEELIEGGLNVLYQLKKKEAAFWRLEEFTNEIRRQWKYGGKPELLPDEEYIDYIYRKLHEVMGEAADE